MGRKEKRARGKNVARSVKLLREVAINKKNAENRPVAPASAISAAIRKKNFTVHVIYADN